jgi:hypothetical protein
MMLLLSELDKALQKNMLQNPTNSDKPSTDVEGRPRRPTEQPTTPVRALPSGIHHASGPNIKPYTCFNRHTGFNQHRTSAQRPIARFSRITAPSTHPSAGSAISSGQFFFCSASVAANVSACDRQSKTVFHVLQPDLRSSFHACPRRGSRIMDDEFSALFDKTDTTNRTIITTNTGTAAISSVPNMFARRPVSRTA